MHPRRKDWLEPAVVTAKEAAAVTKRGGVNDEGHPSHLRGMAFTAGWAARDSNPEPAD